jgi:uncharacterized protein YndB with AHSA1/START domain
MTEATTEATADGIRIVRVFDAPRELVFRAWTEPARFAYWFGGETADVPLDTVTMDVRPGGGWRATMYAGPDRMQIDWHGQYREVDAPERLVLTLSDRQTGEYELLTVVLTDLGDSRTEMLFTQTGGHLSADEYGQAKDGWTGFLEALDAHLRGAA